MSEIKITIDSIMGGQSPMTGAVGKGQFMNSVAIDPEQSILGKPKGHIYPVGYSTFSSTKLGAAPMWMMTSPANTKFYVYTADGELLSYTNAMATETEAVTGTIAAGGNGAAYYNDYIYMAEPTKIWRYGPIAAGSPAISNSLIANSELLDGWNAGSDTALTSTTYPGVRNVTYPNHAMHVHTDGALYLCDFVSGVGMIHKIKTTYAGTNDGSQYNVLDLPFDVRPFDIESYGTDLAIIGATIGSDTVLQQGKSWLFLWDTISDSFYRQIPIPSAYVTAVVNVRGQLYIWGGATDFGWQLYRYNGGYDVELLWDSINGSPPCAGAVDTYGDRIIWGNYLATPVVVAQVLSYGYQNSRLGKDVIHSIGYLPATQAFPIISSLKFAQSNAQGLKRPIIGGRSTATGSEYILSQFSASATKISRFYSEIYKIGRPFKIKQISITLNAAVDSSVTISPLILFDAATVTKTLPVINNTNYPGEKDIKFKAMEIEAATTDPDGYIGKQDFYLELQFSGASATGVELPIEIILETRDD